MPTFLPSSHERHAPRGEAAPAGLAARRVAGRFGGHGSASRNGQPVPPGANSPRIHPDLPPARRLVPAQAAFYRDSTLFFYGKLIRPLDGDATLPAGEKAEARAHLADYHRRSNDFGQARLLADRAWVLAEQGGVSAELRYGIRMIQARLELATGGPRKALVLLRAKLALVPLDDSPFTQARVLKDKGFFTASTLLTNALKYALPKGSLGMVWLSLEAIGRGVLQLRIAVEDIRYPEADRNYCHLHTRAKTFTLATPLKVMEEKLPARLFLRVHRSFLVNLAQVGEVVDDYVGIVGQTVPPRHSLREELMRRIQTV